MARYRTKVGKYGTLYRYRIGFRDPDPTCEVFYVRYWAYDRDHAIERFYEGPEGDAWSEAEIVSVERVRDAVAP